MIFEAHVVVYSRDAAADRAFRTDVLGLSGVDAGGGWLIFALPPAEMAVHPADHNDRHQLYFMCDDLAAQMRVQSAKASRTRMSKKRTGAPWPRFGCRAEAASDSTSPSIRWRSHASVPPGSDPGAGGAFV